MFPVIAAIPCMLGVATKYCQSEKTIVVAFFCIHTYTVYSTLQQHIHVYSDNVRPFGVTLVYTVYELLPLVLKLKCSPSSSTRK